MVDKICVTCEFRIGCSTCGKQICICQADIKDGRKRPHMMNGYYLLDSEVRCVDCHKNRNPDRRS